MGLIEAVYLVHKKDRALAVQAAALLGLADGCPDVSHARQHGIEGDEMGPGGIGDDTGQSGLAGSGGP